MPLATGTRLGPHEILGALGAGGMGEVYRARDTRLDRTVAIKVIPTHLAALPEVRERFEREARAVSSLNHPHICTLFDVGEDRGMHFIVMELLEGETLAHRLEKGPLPIEETLRVAIQIADALASAHRHGLVHRDLKPGNIMLTRAGGAKLLDFGLARATGLAASPGSGLTQSPTLSRPLTAEGTIVGTFQYMAPEQLEGKEADARTDIFAFGAVLYEMATGKRAFEGSSQASLIASILKEQPRPMTEIAPLSPPALEHVVKRALAKQPDERWQNVSDVKHQLEWIRDAGSGAGVPAPIAARKRRGARIAWLLAGVLGLAALGLGALALTRRPAPVPTMRVVVLPPPNQIIMPVQAVTSVSPDGSRVVFAAVDSTGVARLWLRGLDSHQAIQLPQTEDPLLAFWSPDGREIAFASDLKLRIMTLADRNVRTLADASEPRGGSWGKNGDIIFQPNAAGPIMHIMPSGGTMHAVTVVDTASGERAHRFPFFLPDGKHFTYAVLPYRDGQIDVKIGSLDGESTPLLRAGSAPVFANGYLLFSRGDQLVAQRFDPDALELEGEPISFGERPGSGGSLSSSHGAAVSTNGVMVQAPTQLPKSRVVLTDRTGREKRNLTTPPGLFVDPRFSPNGDRIALTQWRDDNKGDLWIMDIERDAASRFTFVESENSGPRWSPDGRTIAFVTARDGRESIYVKPADGSREETRLFESATLFTKPRAWVSNDLLVYEVLTEATGCDIWRTKLDGTGRAPLLQTKFYEGDSRVSPDGRWIVYRSDESGPFEVYVRSFPDMGEKHRISTGREGVLSANISFPLEWIPATNEIVYLARDGFSLMSVSVKAGPWFSAAPPRRLFRLPSDAIDFGMAPDGRSAAILRRDTGGLPEVVHVVLNWPALVERR